MQPHLQIVYDFNSHSPLEQNYFSTTMQLIFKFLLLAIALAYGGTTILALPVGYSSLEARSVEHGDITFLARESLTVPHLHDRAYIPDLFVSLFYS